MIKYNTNSTFAWSVLRGRFAAPQDEGGDWRRRYSWSRSAAPPSSKQALNAVFDQPDLSARGGVDFAQRRADAGAQHARARRNEGAERAIEAFWMRPSVQHPATPRERK